MKLEPSDTVASAAMRTVNCYLLLSALCDLVVAEAENGRPLELDPDDEFSTKRAFRAYICPSIARWSPERRERLKLALVYFLDQPDVLDNDVLANLPDLTMHQPTDMRRFFLWLFESIFPGDRPTDVDVANVQEVNDSAEINWEVRG